jgi:hypothetical protein
MNGGRDTRKSKRHLTDYRYELRRGEEIIATGRLSREEPLEEGEGITIAGHPGVVRAIEPQLGDRTLHLVLEAGDRSGIR